MNLIKRETKESVPCYFRASQYKMYPEMIVNGLNYLIGLGLKYDPTIYNVDNPLYQKIVPDLTYRRIGHYAVSVIKDIRIVPNVEFMNLNIPDLIQDSFFQLNGGFYIPIYYIADEPIIVKEASIVLTSTFQPITIYFGNNRAIFTGVNIVLSDFLQILSYDWPAEARNAISSRPDLMKITFDDSKTDKIIDYLSTKLYCDPDIQAIKNRMSQLFFDDWTKELYKEFYGIEPTIDNVIKEALFKLMFQKRPKFTDLRFKRLTFIEPILRPYFKAISKCSGLLMKGIQPLTLRLPRDAVVKGFFNDLFGNVLYDTVNGFSSILLHKASFKNPFSKGRLPTDVSSIHLSHKGRLCTNSITNQDPGQTVSLIPDQDIHPRYGRFAFSEEEINLLTMLEETDQ